MIEALDKIVHILNDLSPIGLAGGLVYVIYLLVAKKGPVKTIAENHLSSLPGVEQNIAKLVESAERQEDLLGKALDGINYLRGRVNGRAG